ncbi:MAG: decarboxylating NADP(+)-dependent phosphogluconate dehydrogenase [Candidatus Sumerlaeia bacterium]|nr:decarboxylating NADP(+)-dependent phosphogluconate dehydrogenase [Candidatus Sumerlaeia bacterium]
MAGTQRFGVVGLAVMGANIALNISDRGFPISVYNRTGSVTDEFLAKNPGRNITGAKTLEEFTASLERPRRILVMVKAGAAVDGVIAQLRPLLEDGDLIIDGGNSLYSDTERRTRELEAVGLRFLGMGVSGGEEGARFGPSLMPGGTREGYESISDIVQAISAKTDSGPCVTYVGRGSAGHFVKMVHNGIEYGDMQLIAEAYDLLRTIGGLDAPALERTFTEWNTDPRLQSFLIEITSKIVARKDPETGGVLLDYILDKAGQKGTGKWTTVAALDLGVPVPTITAAVDARLISGLKDERVAAAEALPGPKAKAGILPANVLAPQVASALYAAKVMSYAQGMAMLTQASKEFGYGLNLREIARIWKGGCIIRAALLDEIMKVYESEPAPVNLLVSPYFSAAMQGAETSLRRMVALASEHGLAVPALSASLAYFDGYRRARGPAYLIQAQRDYFGAHTFERTDRPGAAVHFDWLTE